MIPTTFNQLKPGDLFTVPVFNVSDMLLCLFNVSRSHNDASHVDDYLYYDRQIGYSGPETVFDAFNVNGLTEVVVVA